MHVIEYTKETGDEFFPSPDAPVKPSGRFEPDRIQGLFSLESGARQSLRGPLSAVKNLDFQRAESYYDHHFAPDLDGFREADSGRRRTAGTGADLIDQACRKGGP